MRKIIGCFLCAITVGGLVLVPGIIINNDYKAGFFSIAAIIFTYGCASLIHYLLTRKWRFWEEV